MISALKKIFRVKRVFVNSVIVFCVVYMSVYLQECLWVQVKTGANTAPLAQVAVFFFGGELLCCCLACKLGQTVKPKEKNTVKANGETDWSESV